MKQVSFATVVNREDIIRGAEDLSVDLNEHINFVAQNNRERTKNFPGFLLFYP
jgi:predicted hydrolase (HD superfamily)